MEQAAEWVGEYALVLLAGFLAIMAAATILCWRWIENAGRRFPNLRAFLARRVSPTGYLGIYLTIGLGLILTALFFFFELAEGIWGDVEIARFDQALAGGLHRHASPTALRLFFAVTQLGSLPALLALGLVVGLRLMVRREWLLLAGWAVALIGGGLLNLELKALFRRARPALPNPFVTESGWSFPSGHAMGALIVYGMLAYLLLTLFHGKGRRWIVLSTAVTILLIGVSRTYLGVHYFSDVIAGYVAGMAWLAVCITGTEGARRYRLSSANSPGSSSSEEER